MFRSSSKSSVSKTNSSDEKITIDEANAISSNQSSQVDFKNDWKHRWSRGRQLRCWVKSSLSSLQQVDEVGKIYETPSRVVSKQSTNQIATTKSEGIPNDAIMNVNEEGEFSGCQNIDEALMAFSGWKFDNNISFDERDDSECSYDWLVDGLLWVEEEDNEEATEPPQAIKHRPKKQFGDIELDAALGDLELEQKSTSTVGSICIDGKVNNFKENPNDKDNGGCQQNRYGKTNHILLKTEAEDESDENSNPLIHTVVSFDGEGHAQQQQDDVNTSLSSSSDGDSTLESKSLDENLDQEEDDLMKYSNNWLKSHPMLSNISTPEQRFFRRLQISTSERENKIENALADDSRNDLYLEHLYDSRDYNPFFEALNDLNHAWPTSYRIRNNTQGLNDQFMFNQILNQNLPDLEESLTASLCKLDEAEQKITVNLVQRIQEKEDELQNAMYRVQHIDEDVHAASLYAASSQKCLQRAISMHSSDLNVIKQANTRDRLRSLQKVILEVSRTVQLENEITSSKKWEASQLPTLVENANTLKEIVLLSELRNLNTLAPMRQRVQHVMFFVRTQIIEICLQEFVCKRCDRGSWNSFCSDEYKTLVQVVVTISEFEHEEWECYKTDRTEVKYNEFNDICYNKAGEENSNAEDNYPPTIAKDWAITILKALCFEASRSVGKALLLDGKHDQSSFAKDLFQISSKINEMSLTDNDSASLRSLTHNLFAIRFEFCEFKASTLIKMFHKLCALLADVIHKHYILTQWHLSPFDEKNSDIDFLHRNAFSNENSDEKQTQHEKEETNIKNASLGTKCATSNQTSSVQGTNQKDHWLLPLLSIEIIKTRLNLWRHIESVLVSFLDNYIYYSNKKSNQQNINGDNHSVDVTWSSDLEDMHDLLQLSNQMISLGIEFLGSDIAEKERISSLGSTSSFVIKEKLHQIFCKHLRAVHIEAMTGLGAMISNETWHLIPLKLSGDVDSNHQDVHAPTKSKERIKQSLGLLLDEICPDFNNGSSTKRHWENLFIFAECNGQRLLPSFNKFGNPFLYKITPSQFDQVETFKSATLFQVTNESKADKSSERKDIVPELYQVIGRIIDVADPNILPIATQSTINGLAKWTSRLLSIMKKLPIIADDIATVISNLFDLFFLTSFRLCMGTEKNEKIVLGIDERSNCFPHSIQGQNNLSKLDKSRKSSKNLQKISSFGKSDKDLDQQKLENSRISFQTVEADICAPLRSEFDEVGRLRDFILLGQESLAGMVDLNKMEEWIAKQHVMSNGICSDKTSQDEEKILASILQQQAAAAFSCLFATALLDVTVDRARKDLTHAFVHSSLGGHIIKRNQICFEAEPYVTESLISISVHSRQAVVVSPTLCHIGNRFSASRAVKARSTISEIISLGNGWTESTMNEHCNEYAEDLCDRCTRLWDCLVSSPSKLPQSVLKQIWHRVVEASYLSLLEGFSRVVSCSTEGRALMSMDLATLSSGFNHLKSHYRKDHAQYFDDDSLHEISLQKVMQCVDTYIKVFYFPEEDVIKWIDDNRDTYHLNQLRALVACGIGARLGLNHPKILGLFSKLK